jgi:hypothetical protein
MATFADMALVAIEKAIAEDPECALRLHAAIMVHGGRKVRRLFHESETFAEWRDARRAEGGQLELVAIYKKVVRIAQRYNELGDPELAEAFERLGHHLVKRLDQLAAKVLEDLAECSDAPKN